MVTTIITEGTSPAKWAGQRQVKELETMADVSKAKEKFSRHLVTEEREGWKEEDSPGREPGEQMEREETPCGVLCACAHECALEHVRACVPVAGGRCLQNTD